MDPKISIGLLGRSLLFKLGRNIDEGQSQILKMFSRGITDNILSKNRQILFFQWVAWVVTRDSDGTKKLIIGSLRAQKRLNQVVL